MFSSYLRLSLVSLIPAVVAVIIYLVNKHTAFNKKNKKTKKIIYGLIYGMIAILGTEFGVPLNGAQLNCRDAAVLVAGLFFGAESGLIAGFLAGIERMLSVFWGVGKFTWVACSISTIIAGIYAATLRKFLFNDKKPGFLISFVIGIVMEVFHMTMIFITNMKTPIEAMKIVSTCSLPMILSNGLSVLFAGFFLSLVSKDFLAKSERSSISISKTIQGWLLVTVILAFVCTSFFLFRLQNTIAIKQTDSTLDLAIEDISLDIYDASDENLLSIARRAKEELGNKSLEEIRSQYNVAEINIIDSSGKIIDSTNELFVGFDMNANGQSRDFLCLLEGEEEYVQKYGPISFESSIYRKYAGVKYEDGFVQVGYNADEFQEDIKKQVITVVKNRHVGETGFMLIFDEKYSLISFPSNVDKKSVESSKVSELNDKNPDTTYSIMFGNEKYYYRYQITEGYYLISVLSEKEANQMRNIALYVNTFLEILVFAVVFGLIYLLINKVVVEQMNQVNGSLMKITDGNLDTTVDVRTNEEFTLLSEKINLTVSSLKKYIKEASERIDKELEIAKSIQFSALPNVKNTLSNHKEFEIFASMNPQKEVGGDFYDSYLSDSNKKINILIADVSGKGIPAAMFMMRAKTEIKNLTEENIPLSDVFTNVNNNLCDGNDASMFVTAWEGQIDIESGILRYVNAGHNSPLLKKKNGKFEFLKSKPGFVLAGMEGIRYKEQEILLEEGDVVFLYTDGVTEATNVNNELYGDERLINALNAKEFDSVEDMCSYIKKEVDGFAEGREQFDDITMLAFKFNGIPKSPMIEFNNASIDDISVITEFIEKELEKIECPQKIITQLCIAIDEIYSNIVKYAYPEEKGYTKIRMLYKENEKKIYVNFFDNGIPYNPLVKDDPNINLSVEDRSIGGLGVFMVKKMMSNIKYKYENGQNILTIMKEIE